MPEKPKSCASFEILISEYACDGPADMSAAERGALEKHLAACPYCRKALASWRKAQARLQRLFPPPARVTADDVPEHVVQSTRKRILDRIGKQTGRSSDAPVLSRSTAPSSPKRDYVAWASWACAIAAVAVLAVGIVSFCSFRQDRRDQSSVVVATISISSPKPVSQLREEFDRLVERNTSRQVNVSDFDRKVRAIIANCQALLARDDLPEANAIHAQKLLADAYGALAEYQKEFTAYLAFAESLSRYYAKHPEKCAKTTQGVTIGQDVTLSILLHKADGYREAGYYLQAIDYYAEVKRAFSESEYAPYCLYRIGGCYIAQDLPNNAEACYVELEKQYPDSPWSLDLLRSKAALLLKQYRRVAAADTWLRVSDLSHDVEDKTRAAILAAQILSEEGHFERATKVLRNVLSEHRAFAYRDYAQYCLRNVAERELYRIVGNPDDILAR